MKSIRKPHIGPLRHRATAALCVATVAALCCLGADRARSSDLTPTTAVRSITIRITTPDPQSGHPLTKNLASYGASNDTLGLDLGRFFAPLEVAVAGNESTSVLEHAKTDIFELNVPGGNDTDQNWIFHHSFRRLPMGLQLRDLTRCRLIIDHGGNYPDWYGDRIEIDVNGRPFAHADIRRFFGDAFGREWDVPTFKPPAPYGGPVFAKRLALTLLFRGDHPWRLKTAGLDMSVSFNLGGRSWRLHEGMVNSRFDRGDGRRAWTFHLPLDNPLRQEEVRLIELYRTVDYPDIRKAQSLEKGFPPASCQVERLTLVADGKTVYVSKGVVLPREAKRGYFFFRVPFSPSK